MRIPALAPLLVLVLSSAALGQSAPCGGPFDAWLAEFHREASAKGISGATWSEAAPLLKSDPAVLAKDRGQQVFTQTFVEFAGRMAEGYRLPQAKQRIRDNAATFSRIEREFGVPAEVIVAFWALETDFGANMGDVPTLRALATLAHDCRRPELFREQLLAALQILQRRDLRLSQMKGPFAGELGQLQFLPAHYLDYAVDYDSDGHRDLIGSTSDALASAGNYASRIGWRRGEPWLEEVRLPEGKFPFEEGGIDVVHARSEWSRWGLRRTDGSPLPGDALQASLLLPVGRHGPAFLAYENFRKVHLEWNKSLVYATTAAYLATRIAGAPRMTVAGKIPSLTMAQMKTLQQELTRRGFEVGRIDGVLGVQTRSAVREVQKELGLPADSWPTTELLQAMHARGPAAR